MRGYQGVLLGLAATLVCAGAAQAQTKTFGAPIDGWVFTATVEKPGVTNCRATRKMGKREDIIALRNNHKGYLSVSAEGRKGDWPKTIINIPGKPRGQMEWVTTASANGIRMWFPIETGALEEIVNVGAYEFHLGDSEDSGRVNLSKRGGDIMERVTKCVLANGG